MDCSLLNKNDMSKISHSFLFTGTDADFILRVLSDPLCEIIRFNKGDVIFNREDYKNSIGLILSGEVEASKTASEHKYLMNSIGPGGIFGAAALFTQSDEYVTVLTALRQSRIVFFPQELLERLILMNPAAAVNYITFLSGRIRFLNMKIQSLISVSAGQTVAQYLIGHMTDDSGRLVVRSTGSLKALSERLNIGRTSLYRALSQLETRGIIKKEGKSIEILNLDALASVK
jgi:CRP-like cAMP-binding protein